MSRAEIASAVLALLGTSPDPAILTLAYLPYLRELAPMEVDGLLRLKLDNPNIRKSVRATAPMACRSFFYAPRYTTKPNPSPMGKRFGLQSLVGVKHFGCLDSRYPLRFCTKVRPPLSRGPCRACLGGHAMSPLNTLDALQTVFIRSRAFPFSGGKV